jgi:hypothetical protein
LKTYNSHTAYPQVDATIEGELWKLDHPRIAKVRRLISKAIGRALPERVT